MGYQLHIERDDEIDIDEWKTAVKAIEGARIDGADRRGQNPKTGEVILMKGHEGNVSILFISKGFIGFGRSEEWCMSIYFHSGRASFNATEHIEDKKNPVHVVAAKLAKMLNARIVGDQGEEYDW